MKALIKRNVGKLDAIVRIIFAIAIVALGYLDMLTGPSLIISGAVAAIALITGFINFCPLYALLKIKTNK